VFLQQQPQNTAKNSKLVNMVLDVNVVSEQSNVKMHKTVKLLEENASSQKLLLQKHHNTDAVL